MPDFGGIVDGGGVNGEIAELGALNPKTVLANRGEMRAARNEGDVLPALRELSRRSSRRPPRNPRPRRA